MPLNFLEKLKNFNVLKFREVQCLHMLGERIYFMSIILMFLLHKDNRIKKTKKKNPTSNITKDTWKVLQYDEKKSRRWLHVDICTYLFICT